MKRQQIKPDHTLEPDPDRVVRIALDLVEKIRDEDPRRMFDELSRLAERHPAKYAQVTMALAAFVNPDEGTVALEDRVWSITEARVAHHISAVAV